MSDATPATIFVLHGSATQNATAAASAGVRPSASFWKKMSAMAVMPLAP